LKSTIKVHHGRHTRHADLSTITPGSRGRLTILVYRGKRDRRGMRVQLRTIRPKGGAATRRLEEVMDAIRSGKMLPAAA